jgi:hydrogenase maturation protease
MDARAGREPRVLVIGMGNEHRGDDAVGLIVARRLKQELTDDATVLEASGEGTALIAAWKGADAVVLIDAARSGGEPGTLYRLEAHTQPIPVSFLHCSTHAISAADAIELARALGEIPPQLIVYGIESKSFEAGAGLSPEAEKAAQEVVSLVRREVGRMARGADAPSVSWQVKKPPTQARGVAPP